MFYLAILVFTWPVYLRPLNAIDFWKQIYTGRYLWFFRKLPHHSTFTFSPVNDFLGRYAYNWLGNLFFYGTFEVGGYPGLFLFRLITLLLAISFLHGLLNFRRTLPVFLTLVVFVYGIFGKLVFRNVIFSVVFFPLFMFLLLREGNGRSYLWILPPLFVLWGNLHGNYYVGLAVFLLLVIGRGIDALKSRDIHVSRQLILVVMITVVGVTIFKPFPDPNLLKPLNSTFKSNPSPPENTTVFRRTVESIPDRLMYYYEVFVEGNDSKRLIDPNRVRSMEQAHPLTARSLFHVPLNFLVVLVGGALFFLAGRTRRWELLLPFGGVAGLGLLYLRATPFVSLVGFFLLSRQFTLITSEKPISFLRTKYPIYLSTTLVTLFVFLYSIGLRSPLVNRTGLFLPYYSKEGSPSRIGATVGWGLGSRFESELPEWILKNYPEQKMINSYTIGGFLIWKWWPYKKVFLDSKITAYNKKFTNKLFNLSHDKHEYYLRKNLHYAIYERRSEWIRRYFGPSHSWSRLKNKGSLALFRREPLVEKQKGRFTN